MTYYVLVSNYNENVKVNDLCQRYGGINMAKKVRFPLEMEDGVEVRSMEELRVIFHYRDYWNTLMMEGL